MVVDMVNAEPDTRRSRVAVDVVGYGRPATSALARHISDAKSTGHPLDPITVVVPSNTAGLAARRLLTIGDTSTGLRPVNLANVSFVTPFRLAELLGSAHVGDRRPLTNPVLAAAVRATLSARPGMFAAVADHHATQSAVASVYSELSRAAAGTRARIAAGSSRGAEVVRVVEETAARLTGYYDEDDLAAAATARLLGDSSAAEQLGTLIWHLPGRLSPAMGSLVGAALARAEPAAAAIVALTGVPEADAAVLGSAARAGVVVGGTVTTASVSQPFATRLVSASDADEEVRQVVREVMQLVTNGTPLDRIAIFRPTAGSYERTIIDHLEGAGIPHNGPSARRLSDTVAGRTLLSALALPRNGWGRGDVIGLIAGAPVVSGGRSATAREWDDASRSAGVVGGLADWQSKLADLIATLEATVADSSGGASSSGGRPRRDASGQHLDTTRRLAAFVSDLAGRVASLDGATTWAERAQAARTLVHSLLGPDDLRAAWPEAELTAAARVDDALARLATLDHLDADPSRATFELAVAAELEVTVGRTGRFGEGVLVAPLASAVGHDLDAVFILGMAEGTCPAFRRDEVLLPDADRQRAEDDDLVTQDERLRTQHRNYLAALAAGGRLRTLVFPRGDLRGRRDRLPSRWLLDSASATEGRRVFSSTFSSLGPEVVHTVASFAGGVAGAEVHGSTAERDVAALLSAGPDASTSSLVTGDLARGFTARRARAGPDFTEWDGNLAGQTFPSPATGVPLSSSRLEAWAACPFKYFLANVLHLSERDDPERIVEISPADKGTLIHAVLEQFITEVLARPAGPPAPDSPWTRADRDRVVELARAAFADVEGKGLTGRPLPWRRTQIEVLADLDEFLTRDDIHRRDNRVTPAAAEMSFGMHGEPPLTLELPKGKALTFRGMADRVDVGEDGHLVVLDYKTGSPRSYEGLGDDPVKAGTALQLGVYAEAAKAARSSDVVEAYYWMISGRGEYKKLGYEWTPDHRTRFLDVAAAIVDGIEAGVFPAQPGEFDSFWGSHQSCGHCDFDRICPRDRDDHQRATADAPQLTVLERLRIRTEGA